MNDHSKPSRLLLTGDNANVIRRAMGDASFFGKCTLVAISRVHSGDIEFRRIKQPVGGFDLAEAGSDRSAVFIAARQFGKTEMQNKLLKGAIRDLGVRVEEAPEAPAPATDAPQTVTLEQIEAKIVREDYIQDLNGGTLTICVLTLANGFDVVGTSGCADPAKFDAELGRKYAREDAIEKIWPLEGYLLRERMWQASYPAQGEDAGKPCDMRHLGIDGVKWAAEFHKIAIKLGYSPMDQGWLDGWFCNAIMAGYDEARRRYEQPVRAADEGWGDPRKNDYSRPMDAQDAPVTASAAVKPVDPADTEWRRLRALDMAVQAGSSIVSGMLIEHAKEIDAYLLGEDAQADKIDAARETLIKAILRGSDDEVLKAADAIDALNKLLNSADDGSEAAADADRQRELAEGIAHERKRAGVAA